MPQAVSRWVARDRPSVGPGRVAVIVTQRDLQPDSFAFDPTDGTRDMGSICRRKVEGFVAKGSTLAVLGMKLNPTRRADDGECTERGNRQSSNAVSDGC